MTPFVFLLLLELALRGIGFGYPTGYFLKATQNGREVIIENQAFSRRFFPPGLERTPPTVVLPVLKPPGALRIFVFGESAAMGDPEPAYGFPRILQVMLAEQMPGRHVEVINVALTAINSHVIREIARDCAAQKGDYWVVYMGNNEVVGPYGAGTVFGTQVPSLSAIRANLALKKTRVGQALDALRWRLARGRTEPTAWEGMEMFLQQQVPSGDPRLARAYENFEGNLRDILDEAKACGATALVATVAVNLKDSAPFASIQRPGLSPDQLTKWQQQFESAQVALLSANAALALTHLTNAAAIDDQRALGQYLIGQAHLALGRTNDARAALEKALEFDALRFRADARLNGIIRTVATQRPGVELIDVAARLAERSPGGIPGREFFHEHVHFNFAGNYEVARLIAARIQPATSNRIEVSLERCGALLAHTRFDQYRVLDEVRQRMEKLPFRSQWDQAQRAARLRQELDGLQRARFADARAAYESAITSRPADFWLRENFGTLLKDFDQLDDALIHWKRLAELAPHSADAWIGLGDTLDTLGRSAEAVVMFRRALQLRPESVETRNGLALALAGAGDALAAIQEFEKALRYRPTFAEARVNLGRLLAAQGRPAEARAQYEEALRHDSNNVPGHINLGKLLAESGQSSAAIAQYREAIRIKPEHAAAHFNLANALTTAGDPGTARQHYAEAIRLNPRFVEARYRLGLALARDGQNAGALEQFTEVVALDPTLVDGHFNLGVALARTGRFDEAITQFEETLRRQPSHPRARQFLEQSRARQLR